MDNKQSDLGTIFFHVALLAIIVVLVDERLIRAGLAIIPGMLLAQRAIGATAATTEGNGDWTGIHDRRMAEHVREHVDRLLSHFREFYALNHLMSSGRMTPEEALVKASDLEGDLNRLLDDVSAGPQGMEAGTPEAAPAAEPVGS